MHHLVTLVTDEDKTTIKVRMERKREESRGDERRGKERRREEHRKDMQN